MLWDIVIDKDESALDILIQIYIVEVLDSVLLEYLVSSVDCLQNACQGIFR